MPNCERYAERESCAGSLELPPDGRARTIRWSSRSPERRLPQRGPLEPSEPELRLLHRFEPRDRRHRRGGGAQDTRRGCI